MKVQYVGRQKPHRERLYATGVMFSGPGDVQEVPDDKAQKMINRHPDQYAEAGAKPAAPAKTEAPQGPEGDAPFLVMDGEATPLEEVSKDVLIEVAKQSYDREIPSRTNKPEVIEIVAQLIAELGQPQAKE